MQPAYAMQSPSKFQWHYSHKEKKEDTPKTHMEREKNK
jgi:hypothetical protein